MRSSSRFDAASAMAPLSLPPTPTRCKLSGLTTSRRARTMRFGIMIEGQEGLTWERWWRLAAGGGGSRLRVALPLRPPHRAGRRVQAAVAGDLGLAHRAGHPHPAHPLRPHGVAADLLPSRHPRQDGRRHRRAVGRALRPRHRRRLERARAHHVRRAVSAAQGAHGPARVRRARHPRAGGAASPSPWTSPTTRSRRRRAIRGRPRAGSASSSAGAARSARSASWRSSRTSGTSPASTWRAIAPSVRCWPSTARR